MRAPTPPASRTACWFVPLFAASDQSAPAVCPASCGASGRPGRSSWETRRGTPPAIFSVHSFSPDYGDTPRPWDIGVLWNRDPRIAVPLMDMPKAHGLNVGDNEPYSGRQLAYTIDVHGGATGLANCVIEINQNQVRDAAGIGRWATILEEIMPEILRTQGLHRVGRF